MYVYTVSFTVTNGTLIPLSVEHAVSYVCRHVSCITAKPSKSGIAGSSLSFPLQGVVWLVMCVLGYSNLKCAIQMHFLWTVEWLQAILSGFGNVGHMYVCMYVHMQCVCT